MSECCVKPKQKENMGVISGIIYGIIPHIFCIAFIIFSVIGAVGATAIFQKIMIISYFLEILVALSFIMATISAIIYLKRNDCLCKKGIKSKWKYLTLLYGITIFVNMLMFYFIIPTATNAITNKQSGNNPAIENNKYYCH